MKQCQLAGKLFDLHWFVSHSFAWVAEWRACHSVIAKIWRRGKKLNRSSPSQKGLVSLASNWHKYSSLGFCLQIVIKYSCLQLYSQMLWLMSSTIFSTPQEWDWNYAQFKCLWTDMSAWVLSLSLYKICSKIHQMQGTIKTKNNKIYSVQSINICCPVVAVN